MSFGYEYGYPTFEKPEFTVKSIEDGYKFVFFDDEGKENSAFSINKEIVQNILAATGYVGIEADAIEKFRSFGKEKWSEHFK